MDAATPLMLGDLTLDVDRRMLCGRQGEVVLRPAAFAVAEKLFGRAGRTVTHDALIERMYDVDAGGEEPEFAMQRLRTEIMLLRALFATLSGGAARIRTDHLVGYRAEVVRASAPGVR